MRPPAPHQMDRYQKQKELDEDFFVDLFEEKRIHDGRFSLLGVGD